MKKLLFLILIGLISLVGCNNEKVDIDSLTIYSLNDLHGAVDNGNMSIIGDFLINEKKENPNNTLILAAGDMLQGTAISNMSRGKVVIEFMNKIGFDAMTIGNHEFDWGVDVIKSFKNDGEVKADFPFLGANIYEKESDQIVDWVKPYEIVEKGDVKVGIIGTIGSDLTNSISPSVIEPYKFIDEFSVIKQYTKELRTEKNVDIVIILSHSNTLDYNSALADLSGDYQVDAVINGHTHSSYAGETLGLDNKRMPYIQSSSNANLFGKITLQLDGNNKLVDGEASNLSLYDIKNRENKALNKIIQKYNKDIEAISNEVIGIAGKYISRNNATIWAANVIRERTSADVGIVNTGGIRSVAFPIYNNEAITVGRMWRLMPFDNFVKTVDMKVYDIIEFLDYSGIAYSNNIILNSNYIEIDENKYMHDDILNVATVDYLFDNPDYKFLYGDNIVNTGDFIRDYLIEDIRNNEGKWHAN